MRVSLTRILFPSFFLFVLLFLVTPRAALAATQMYLSPASASVASGQEFAVAIRENSGADTVNAVQANLSYNAAQLDVSSVSYTGSAFGIQVQELRNTGSVAIGVGSLTPVTGDNLVATVTFKAKTGVNASATVQFASGTEVISSVTHQNVLTSTSGGTYRLGSGSPSPSPTPTPTLPPTPIPTVKPSPTTLTVDQGLVLGYKRVGGETDCDNGYLNGSKFTMGRRGGLVSSMSVAVGDVDQAPNNQFELGIYTDKRGRPDQLVAKSGTGILQGNTWNTLPVSATLQARKTYWLMYATNGSDCQFNGMKFDRSFNPFARIGGWTHDPVSFGVWPNPFGPADRTNMRFSIYASYTAQ